MSALHYSYTGLIPQLVTKLVTYTGPICVTAKNTHTRLVYSLYSDIIYTGPICVTAENTHIRAIYRTHLVTYAGLICVTA